MKLYRFERATKVRADTLLQRMLWASKPKHFNDLTDCQLDFDAFAELRWDQATLARALEVFYPGGAVPDDMPLTGHMLDTLRQQTTPRGRGLNATLWRAHAQADLREAIANSVAVCCFFGAEDLSPLMWAHYGDNHRGLCVEYEVAADDADSLHKVDYSSRRPTVTLTELLFSPWETVLRVVRTKHLAWAYEREHRMVLMSQEARDSADGVAAPFPNWLRPARVIVGARATDAAQVDGEFPLKVALRIAEGFGMPLHQVVRRGQGLIVQQLPDGGPTDGTG